jgi:5-oxopent-3-ene-1,2,5-tricarboxylate decarboxylase/2-hydroxyhepta-2,4-diene-1,7-dioate isomerase
MFDPARSTVYGVVLNHGLQLHEMGEALVQPPYGKPPIAPVLYIKPPNTFLPGGGEVPVPPGLEALEMGAAIAAVIGRTACRVSEDQALGHVAGFAPAIDVTIPHKSLHRPAIRQRCRDGFLPIGDLTPGLDAESLSVGIRLNGKLVGGLSAHQLVRSAARLIADVTEFMTLYAGDVLLLGLSPHASSLARPGDHVEAVLEGGGKVECRLVPEAAA